MVTVITASGSPILLPSAHDARLEGGRLVCFDAKGERLLSFDPLDVTAFAVETPAHEPAWVMGGAALAMAAPEAIAAVRSSWRLPARLRFTYR